jgi:hypothetical protein
MFSPTPTTGNNSGRTTPSIDVALSVDDSSFQVVSSDQLPKKNGREKGAAAYSASEYLALLSIIADEKNSFNVSEGSTQWATVYKWMIAEYYTPLGMTSMQSTVLQTHFIESYSAFKQGIRRQWHTKINSRRTKKIMKQKWPVNEQQRRSERKQPKIEK